jgi:putative oxidoreductase
MLGLFFVFHGLSKFGIIDGGDFGRATSFFAELQMPIPEIAAPILAVIETLGGLALAFGVMTRTFAILLASIVTVEIIIVKLPETLNPLGQGGYLFELTLLIALITLAFTGPGALALDE